MGGEKIGERDCERWGPKTNETEARRTRQPLALAGPRRLQFRRFQLLVPRSFAGASAVENLDALALAQAL